MCVCVYVCMYVILLGRHCVSLRVSHGYDDDDDDDDAKAHGPFFMARWHTHSSPDHLATVAIVGVAFW